MVSLKKQYFLLISKAGFIPPLIQGTHKEGILIAEGFDLII
jgi:hypothetical protein